mgnify:CR=1 FL=1
MTVRDVMEKLQLKLIAGESGLHKKIKGVYICDLLSWVMSHACNDDAWITIQTHPNIIAVATLLELSCIIIPENAEVEEDTIQKANEEAVPILTSSDSGFKISTSLYELLKG